MHRVLGGAALVVVLSIGLGAGDSVARGPAGRLVVVAEHQHESGGLNYPSDVYVVDVDGRHLRNLTHDNASNGPAHWMPDGKRIIFQSHPSNRERGVAHIYAINRDGTGLRRLTSASGGALPDVSPDGRIAFLIQRPKVWGGYTTPSEWGVYVMDASGRHPRRLVEGHGEVPAGPRWSPDGRMIMFETGHWTRGCCVTPDSLFVVNADGKHLTRLRRSRALSGASWSPRGRTLAIAHYDNSNGGSGLTIAELRRHLGRPTLRPVKTMRDLWPGGYRWSPDGRSIIYQNDTGVWIADLRAHAHRRRFAVPALPWTWSSDRRWFVFSSRRGIEVATATGRARRIVTPKIKNCCPLDEIEWAPLP